jgi:hypothetical protein
MDIEQSLTHCPETKKQGMLYEINPPHLDGEEIGLFG